MATSPTHLTLKKWRKAGYLCQVVERWNPHSKTRHDLFGFVDVLAVGNGETVGIQTTSKSHLSDRLRKVGDSEHIGLLREANWRLVVEGWAKEGRLWQCKEVDVS